MLGSLLKKKAEPPKSKIITLFMKSQKTKTNSDERESEENSIQSPASNLRDITEPSHRANTFDITNNITMLKQQEEEVEPINNEKKGVKIALGNSLSKFYTKPGK